MEITEQILQKILEEYQIKYLITHPNNDWVATVKATSFIEADRKAKRIQKERCLFDYKLWVLTDGNDE
jgi:hypothetical protein